MGLCGSNMKRPENGMLPKELTKDLPCGHLWKGKDVEYGFKCKKSCAVVICDHGSCGTKCWEACKGCRKDCEWKCGKGCENDEFCSNKCGDVCDRKVCNNRCSEILQCGHRCTSLCGELCPELCYKCHPDEEVYSFVEMDSTKLKDINSDEEIIMKMQCSHYFLLSELDAIVNGKLELDDTGKRKIQRLSCPRCRESFYFNRYKDKIMEIEVHFEKITKLRQARYTDKERNDLIKMLSATGNAEYCKGHFYVCKNNHLYCVGNCGQARQSANCPECNEKIGGDQGTKDKKIF